MVSLGLDARRPSFDFLGTMRLCGDGRGASGDEKGAMEDMLWELFAKEGVAEMRRMDGIAGWGGVRDKVGMSGSCRRK